VPVKEEAMRTHALTVALGLLAATALPAGAQQAGVAAGRLPGIDFGVRFTDITGDAARFQRFRDLGDGAFVDRLRFDREGDTWLFSVGADHLGRRDQRYFAEFRGHGKLKITFEWDQVPLFISQDTRTLYRTEAPGVLRIDPSLRQAIEAGRLRLADVAPQASPFEVRSRRDVARVDLVYSATRELDLTVKLEQTRREGTMPWGASFGFNNAVEIPAPIDWRTTDLKAGLEWANARGMFRASYEGSWFDNDIETLVWDNPLRATDTTFAGAYVSGLAGSQGRSAFWPSNSLQGLTTSGAYKLPAETRVTGHLSVGLWRQDEALLPFTINSAIPPIPLERPTAEGEFRSVAASGSITSRPRPEIWLSARYRLYDLANRTPPFRGQAMVVFDQVTREMRESEPLGYTRHTFDADVSFTPRPWTALRVGYGREQADRTFRIFETTVDHVVRASADTTAGWVTLRAIAERAVRRGSGFDEELLEEAGEQPAMRHFDIADRDRNRLTALLQLAPSSAIALSVSAAVGRDDYTHSGFGLRDNRNRAYSVSFDLTPREAIAAGGSYTFEKYTALQRSRQAAPGAQFVDPTRDWTLDTADRVHTALATLDLVRLIPRTELNLTYSYTRSKALYVYGVVPGSTLFAGGLFPAERQLPPVANELRTGTVDLRYFLTPRVAVGFLYWYDRYRVDDFALGPQTIDRIDLPGTLLLGYLYRPYTAHSAWIRLTYLW
jgi:MtrB/PioB family decaheme-associated outer membrane protein